MLLRAVNNFESILRIFSNNFILNTVYRDENSYHIVTEYTKHRCLATYLRTVPILAQQRIRQIMTQLLIATHYMGKVGMIHRDLKLENILIGDDLNLKICDFGFA